MPTSRVIRARTRCTSGRKACGQRHGERRVDRDGLGGAVDGGDLRHLPEQARTIVATSPGAGGLARVGILPIGSDQIPVVELVDDDEVAHHEPGCAGHRQARRAARGAARHRGLGARVLVPAARLEDGFLRDRVPLDARLGRPCTAQRHPRRDGEPGGHPIRAGRSEDDLSPWTGIERRLDRRSVVGHAVSRGVVGRVGHRGTDGAPLRNPARNPGLPGVAPFIRDQADRWHAAAAAPPTGLTDGSAAAVAAGSVAAVLGAVAARNPRSREQHECQSLDRRSHGSPNRPLCHVARQGGRPG